MPLIDQISSAIPEIRILQDEELSDRYSHIWNMDADLKAHAIVLPNSTEELSQILKICHERKQSVVVHGGLTNLVGSTNSRPEDLIISMEKMNKVLEIDEPSRTMTVQAGVILQEVQHLAAQHELFFPLNFGAKGSAQIGGVLASNAGGLRVVKYGMARDLVRGIEVVLADGTIIKSLKKLVKDNSGYDLKQLFIGSEGTLGIITAATLKLVEKPPMRCSALIGLESYSQVMDVFRTLDRASAGALSAIEIMWNRTYRALTSPPSIPKPPLPYSYSHYLLVEMMGTRNIATILEDCLEDLLQTHRIKDAAPAYSEEDLRWFWTIREDVGPMTRSCAFNQQFDISMSTPEIGPFVDRVLPELESISGVQQVYPFGHVGDGNIHLVVGKNTNSKALTEEINTTVYSRIGSIQGSISAEHGIGIDKRKYLHYSRSEQEISLMKTIKKSLDPHGILNPGRIFME